MTDLEAALSTFFSEIGCSVPEIGLLQPADPFLDTTGEDLRRRIFITQENSGTMLCLRPEFTIPVCLAHLENNGSAARYAYGGSVFRQRREDRAEFMQAGFEDLGNPDKKQADIDCINTAHEAMKASGLVNADLVLGDQSIFMKLLDALDIPSAWRKKLARAFGDTTLLRAQISGMTRNSGYELQQLPDPVRIAVEKGDCSLVAEQIANQMIEHGLPLSGGRTPQAIAERILEKAELGSVCLEADMRLVLEGFLTIHTNLAEASTAISEFEKAHGIALAGASDYLEALCSGLGSYADTAQYQARFGRRLDYYTGLVFEIYSENSAKPLVGGGRYDHLMTLLGSKQEIPAVGFAIWVDRLERAR